MWCSQQCWGSGRFLIGSDLRVRSKFSFLIIRPHFLLLLVLLLLLLVLSYCFSAFTTTPTPTPPFSEFAGFILQNVNFSQKYLFNLLDLLLVILLFMVGSGKCDRIRNTGSQYYQMLKNIKTIALALGIAKIFYIFKIKFWF